MVGQVDVGVLLLLGEEVGYLQKLREDNYDMFSQYVIMHTLLMFSTTHVLAHSCVPSETVSTHMHTWWGWGW